MSKAQIPQTGETAREHDDEKMARILRKEFESAREAVESLDTAIVAEEESLTDDDVKELADALDSLDELVFALCHRTVEAHSELSR